MFTTSSLKHQVFSTTFLSFALFFLTYLDTPFKLIPFPPSVFSVTPLPFFLPLLQSCNCFFNTHIHTLNQTAVFTLSGPVGTSCWPQHRQTSLMQTPNQIDSWSYGSFHSIQRLLSGPWSNAHRHSNTWDWLPAQSRRTRWKTKTVFPCTLNYTSLLLCKWVCCFSHGFI